MHQLLSNLYVSAWPDAKTLARERFDTVVTCCWKELPPHYVGIIPNHHHFPMSDSSQIPGKIPEQVDEAVLTVVNSVHKGRKTLVHCYAGHNRSWLVATLAYSLLTGITLKTAYSNVLKIYDGALRNTAFQEYLNDSTYNREWAVRSDSIRHALKGGD
jgi:protein-tyrosine phosphatase